MPWTPKDARKHTRKADTPAKQRKWANVANRVLAETGDDGKALRAANRAVAGGRRRKAPARKKK